VIVDRADRGCCTGSSCADAKAYERTKTLLAVARLLLTVALLVVVVLSGASSWLAEALSRPGNHFYLNTAVYALILGAGYHLFFIWLDFYSGYVMEHRYGLSNQTAAAWLKKELKVTLLSLAVFLIATETLYYCLKRFPQFWWLPAAGAWLAFRIIAAKIVPTLIIPLFYRCRTLANETLKRRLMNLSFACGVPVRNVFEIELSSETTKANAGVVGWGRSRRILLGDTLLKNYSPQEIEAVFAHELAHIRLRHIWKLIGFASACWLIGFYVTFLLFRAIMDSLGRVVWDTAGFPLLALLMMTAGLALTPFQLWYSRHVEKQADLFAAKHIEHPQHLASALRKLARQNLADSTPPRLREIFFCDHPPLSKRVAYITTPAQQDY